MRMIERMRKTERMKNKAMKDRESKRQKMRE